MADKPDCAVCGLPYHRHRIGNLVLCPVIATYRPKPPEAADEITRLNAEKAELREWLRLRGKDMLTVCTEAEKWRQETTAEHEAAMARLNALVDEMREGVEKARDKFSFYSQLHRLKSTAEGDEKADRNQEMADFCEALLAKASSLKGSE